MFKVEKDVNSLPAARIAILTDSYLRARKYFVDTSGDNEAKATLYLHKKLSSLNIDIFSQSIKSTRAATANDICT